MLALIKYYFLIFCALYAYLCMLNSQCRYSDKKALHLILSAVLSVLTCFIHTYAAPARILGMLVFSYLTFTTIFHIPWRVSASATLLSFGCSYLFFTISAFLLSIIESFLSLWLDCSSIKLLFALFLGLLQFFGIICLFHTRRLSLGLPFLWDLGSSYAGLFISIAILTAVSFLSLNNDTHFVYYVLIFSIFVWGIALLFWWRERITKKYIDQINARAAKELEAAISARDLEIAYLKEQNDALAKMIHKDNKLIPAMEYSIRELFRSAAAPMENTSFPERARELLGELEHIFQDRQGLLRNYETAGKQLPSTGIVPIDILLAYMRQKAAESGIDFDVTLLDPVRAVTEYTIPEEDLRALLADLLENALIAASESKRKKVLLTMGSKNGLYNIEIYDSGPPFSKEVLSSLGIRPVTTHKEQGGSGIGLMTVAELCRKYNAGFAVVELADSPAYCKKISVCFGGREQQAF